MDLHNLNLEFQLSLAEKLAGLPSSKLFSSKQSKSRAAPPSTEYLASNLLQKLVEAQICMHERELDALESVAQLQQRDATIARLTTEITKLQEALATSQCATGKIHSKLKEFAGITPQDVVTLRSENVSMKSRLAEMQQQLDTRFAHSQDLTKCATRVQTALKKEASDAMDALTRKSDECRALRQEQALLNSKVKMLESAIGGAGRQSPLLDTTENSNLNQQRSFLPENIANTVKNNSGCVSADVMELQKELTAALDRVQDRESQCRKYKEAIRTLKSRLEEEENRRNQAENKLSAVVAKSTAAEARQQQVKEASREACIAAVRLAEQRAIEAETKIGKLESALSQLQLQRKPQEHQGPSTLQDCVLNEAIDNRKVERKEENEDQLQQERALTAKLKQQLQLEKAQRTQQEGVIAMKTKALDEAEKRQKQLDGIRKRLVGTHQRSQHPEQREL